MLSGSCLIGLTLISNWGLSLFVASKNINPIPKIRLKDSILDLSSSEALLGITI